jgi:hypothetical protein
MRRPSSARRLLPAAYLCVLALLPAALNAQARPADFQSNQHVLVGYVANAPNIFLGGGVMFLNPRLVGFFADVRTTRDSPGDRSNFLPGLSPLEAVAFGDQHFSNEDQWFAVNAGLTRVVTPELALYAGAGYSNRDVYVEFFDDRPDGRGELGFYWVQDEDLSGPSVNALGGFLFRAGQNLVFQLGGESRPLGGTVGVHYALPLRR